MCACICTHTHRVEKVNQYEKSQVENERLDNNDSHKLKGLTLLIATCCMVGLSELGCHKEDLFFYE